MNATSSPEKPRHIDGRINRIETDDLIKAFGSPPGVTDLGALRAFVADGMHRPAWPLREWVDAIRSTPAAEAVLAEAAPLLTGVEVTGQEHGRSRRYGFHYLGWLSPGIQAWLLTGDDRYLHAFEKHLDEWVERRDSVTGEWPGLDVIWYSLGTWARCRNLLPTLEVLTDSPLSDQAWGRLLSTLIGGARWAYDEHDVFRHGNWQLVCATELLHLSAVLPDLVESDSWAARARERIDEHLLLDVYPDGGHYERSPGYHKMCLTALQTAAVIDPDVAAHPKVAAMHAWLCELVSPGGWIPHLQDSHVEWPATALLRGSYVLDDPSLARIAAQWLTPEEFATEAAMLPAWSDPARQRRWTESLASQATVQSQPRTTVLPDSGYVVLRGDDVRAVVNYGPHIEHELESHSHRAVLDLTLDGWRQPLLWEAGGPPSYDDPEYLTWYQSGRGHNTILVDDRELGTDRGVTVDALVDTEQVAIFSGHHRGSGVPQSRTIALVREEPAFIVVSDTSPAAPHTFRACWHSVNPWREVAPLTYDASSAEGPGLLLVEVGNASTTTVEVSEGTARRPLVDRGVAEYGPLHSLGLTRDAGDFTTVFVPHAGADLPNVLVTRDADELTIDHGRTIDRMRSSCWIRTTRTPIFTERLSWATGWQVRSLIDRGFVLLRTSAEVDATARVVDDALQLTVTCTGRCGVWIRASGNISVDGVLVTAEAAVDDWAHLTLPYAGSWTIRGARHE